MFILTYILSGISLLMSLLFLVRLPKPPLGFVVLIPKLTAGALSPVWAVIGAVGALLGWLYQAFWAIPVGILGAGMTIWYVWRCTRDHKGFDHGAIRFAEMILFHATQDQQGQHQMSHHRSHLAGK